MESTADLCRVMRFVVSGGKGKSIPGDRVSFELTAVRGDSLGLSAGWILQDKKGLFQWAPIGGLGIDLPDCRCLGETAEAAFRLYAEQFPTLIHPFARHRLERGKRRG